MQVEIPRIKFENQEDRQWRTRRAIDQFNFQAKEIQREARRRMRHESPSDRKKRKQREADFARKLARQKRIFQNAN